ncbi:hypothetical protein [Myceligenerans xiligouense]|uniref:CopC domain-containing protein n=1 Tax=Myceligenerans xiligouense TaxID=253184 RepID=A0A3N4YLS1_9MICO|nr:hypothetical protein [Myceligenerans xiligouense]RPF20264.1 hypothetical protein EDD34_0844 [Myceligenerans xiligouense]
MQRFTRAVAALALGLGLAVGPAATLPVAAHGGAIDVEVGTDGAGGVSVALVWARDGHPVEESAVVVVRAVSGAGEEVGPVTLASASEGVGWYRSDPELLDEGHWTVTARVKEPGKAKARTELDVAAAPVAEPSAPATDPADVPPAEADGPGTAASASDGARASGVLPGWTGWAAGALVVAGVVTAVVVLRRRTT